MASVRVVVACILYSLPCILSLRYGSNSRNLHVHPVQEEVYMGDRFQTVVKTENNVNYAAHERVRRQAGVGGHQSGHRPSNIVHPVRMLP